MIDPLSSRSALSIDALENPPFSKLPDDITRLIGSYTAEPNFHKTCKQLNATLDFNIEWRSLKTNATKPEIDPLLRQFIGQIEKENPKIFGRDKLKKLFEEVCAFGKIKKAPASLNGISRYSIEFYCKLLESAKQDFSLRRAWPKIRKEMIKAANLPPPDATVEMIRYFLNHPKNQAVVLAVDFLMLTVLKLCAIPQEISLFKGLQSLYLSNNEITAVPENIFGGLTALRCLRLASNQLTALPANIFNELTALQKLDLASNQLTALPTNIFNGLTALQELFLHYNKLTALPANIVRELTALRRLYLQNNPFAAVPNIPNNAQVTL